MSYQRRASPLHAARAASSVAYCLALALAALILSAPVLLGAVALAVIGAGVGAQESRALRRVLWLVVGLGLVVAAVNALVSRDGLTVIVRLGDLPLLGHTDVTLEATVYGAVLGLRAATLVLLGVLYTCAVDPDGVLRLFRRVSFRSALTAAVATRLVPVLLRDAGRLTEAQRCRPGPPPGRLALLRAGTSGALDRALDVAAALEVRGYGGARRPPRTHTPFSRQDIAFALSAVAIVALAVGARAGDLDAFAAYPALHAPVSAASLLGAVALLLAALLPFSVRRGVAP